MPPDPAPGRVHLIHEIDAAGEAIDVPPLFRVDGEHDVRRLAGGDMLRNLVFEGGQVPDVLAQVHAVDPRFRVPVHVADTEEQAPSLPFPGNIHHPPVPARANELVAELFGFLPETLGVP